MSPASPRVSVRVAIWDERRHIKISGEDAPRAGELLTFLAAHHHCRVWRGETRRGGASSSTSLPSVAYPSGSKPALAPCCLAGKRARCSTDERLESDQPALRRTRCTVASPTLPEGFIRQTELAQKSAWENGGATNVLLAMKTHPADAQLQADACQALTFLASHTPEYKRRVCAAGGAVAIVRALETHGTEATVALQGCGALAVLTMDARARAAVREAGGAGALLRAMRLHSNTSRLQQLGCTAIASLAEMHVLPVEPLANAALAAMRAFPAEATLQAQGCRTLLHLASTPPRKRVVCDAGGAGAVVAAMLAHGGEVQVQQWGCGALSAFAEGDESCHRAVRAARRTCLPPPFISAPVSLTHPAYLLSQVCDAAQALDVARLPGGAPSGGGGVHAILHAMAMHPAHVQVAQLGCAALAALLAGAGGASAVQCAAAARAVVAFGGAALTVRAMGRHRRQSAVQLQGCVMLALLAGLNADGAAAARAAASAPAALEALRVYAALPEVVRWGSRVLRALPHPHVSTAAAAAAATRARTLRLSRAMLGSWRLAGHGADGADGKLPLDLVSKVAALACAAEFGVRPMSRCGSCVPRGSEIRA